MRPVATDVACSVVCAFLCLSVCMLVTHMCCAKTAEPIEMPFGHLLLWVHWYGVRDHVSDVQSDVDRVERFRLTLRFFDDVSTAS